MNHTIGSLNLNRPRPKQETSGGTALHNTGSVKVQLLEELVELEKQMETLKQGAPAVNFSMIQTYKEMIHSRKLFFNEINH